jgi:Flp pilus assembly protein TadG
MNSRYANSMQERHGNIIVLTAVMMIGMLAMIVVSVDVGYLAVAKVELQRAADSAALAAAWELAQTTAATAPDTTTRFNNARDKAVLFAANNKVLSVAPIVDRNNSNVDSGDVVIGYLDPTNTAAQVNVLQPDSANAVQVTVRKTAASANGEVSLFFSRVFGIQRKPLQAAATGMIVANIGGFQAPSDGSDIGILPFALDQETWEGMLAGGGDDNWRWDAENKEAVAGSDGVREVNLFPQGTGSPGNRGTVDIGPSNNSNSDIVRQIREGVNASDLAALAADGRSLTLNSEGFTYLNGDTGISAGTKDALTDAIGRPNVIPIFDTVDGPGNNAEYRITGFAGVRIMEVDLTGKMKNKRVIIQPAEVKILGGVPAQTGGQTSWYVYSPAKLVR